MPTEAENHLADAMRRAVEDTRFDPAAIAVARSTVRRRRSILAAAGAALALAGATALGITVFDGGQSGDDAVTTTADELQLMTQRAPGDTYPGAQLEGTLIVTDNQCLAVELGPAEDPFLYSIYWPYGFTAARDATDQATLYNAEGEPVAREGDTVSIGGGLMPENWDYPQGDHPCIVGEVWLAAPDVVTLDQ